MNVYELSYGSYPRLRLGVEYTVPRERVVGISIGGVELLELPMERCVLRGGRVLLLEDEGFGHLVIVPLAEGDNPGVASVRGAVPLATTGSPEGEIAGVFLVKSPGEAIFTFWMGAEDGYRDIIVTHAPGGDLHIAGGPRSPVQWF